MANINDYIENNKDRFLNELLDLLRIPSVSADSKFKGDVLKAAEFIHGKLLEAGADIVEICPTGGHPIVYGEKIIDAKLPTVLVYGHYDVQPADPYELWDSPPFEPVIKTTEIHPEGAIFARGACDDKGQVYMHIKAFEAMMKTDNLACNIKFLIEGEEEVGSDHLGIFLEENKEKLAADIVLVSDTGIIANDVPSITVGLRGLSYVQVEVTGPNRDLHSGLYGGAVPNPINVLAEMIASLKDENKKINIPGFYADVIELSADERAAMALAPFDEEEYKKSIGLSATEGEAGYTSMERSSIRPTLDVNGIWGGYIGEGAKTVIASKAYAKISMRLVPNQDPDKITKLFQDHFTSIAPPSVKVKVIPHHGGKPAVTPTDSPAYIAAAKAMETTFGKVPVPFRGGGSIPIVALFEQTLGLKTVLMGFGLDSDAIHSPNEHYGVFNYFKGIETIPLFFKNFAELND
ncbi:peptidase dimerization domain protein [Roseivirga seohaensis]|uniref:Peptidase dimerization domain protein n=1 Tax=Roseivirga seohaensis TaxID=1914963 RepID=A0A150Y0S3_9BACT|nr:dipeptidase [Roseivirga seohaensis]KYG84526.1 peptidase dimerization domain protein [Roseivirga seohaensis]